MIAIIKKVVQVDNPAHDYDKELPKFLTEVTTHRVTFASETTYDVMMNMLRNFNGVTSIEEL